jgi:hypothetical protein
MVGTKIIVLPSHTNTAKITDAPLRLAAPRVAEQRTTQIY